jgi:multidrug efflux system membrane fusion protein
MKYRYHIIAILILQVFTSCKQEYIKESNTKISASKTVRVLPLERLEHIEPIIASGTLQSKQEIVLSFKIGGILSSLLVEEGQTVKKNQKIGSLNLSEINAQVVSANNTYDKSVRDLERATNLYRDTVGTLEQKQNARTAKEIANSNLEIAQFNRRFAVVNSPVTGKVLQRYVEVGQLVSSGQPIYKIGSSGTNGSQIIRLGLSDKDVVKIALNDSAIVVFDAFEKTEYKGAVSEIGMMANPKTALFEVEITLDDFKGEIKNGFIGKIKIYPKNALKTYKIPMDALVEGNNKQAIIFYTTDNQIAKRATVRIEQFRNNYFSISTSELSNDAMVIIDGAPFLKDNDSIKIVK